MHLNSELGAVSGIASSWLVTLKDDNLVDCHHIYIGTEAFFSLDINLSDSYLPFILGGYKSEI